MRRAEKTVGPILSRVSRVRGSRIRPEPQGSLCLCFPGTRAQACVGQFEQAWGTQTRVLMPTRQILHCLSRSPIPLCLDFKYSFLVHPLMQYIINVPIRGGSSLFWDLRTNFHFLFINLFGSSEGISEPLARCLQICASIMLTLNLPSPAAPPCPWTFFYWFILSHKLGLSFRQTEAGKCLSSWILCIINTDAKHVVDGACQNQL